MFLSLYFSTRVCDTYICMRARCLAFSLILIPTQGKLSTIEIDDVVVAQSAAVKLVCPLGNVPLAAPARERVCAHIRCFDADMYLRMNERWKCPVCNNTLMVEDRRVDDYMVEVVRAAGAHNVVEFSEDGSWHVARDPGLVVVATDAAASPPSLAQPHVLVHQPLLQRHPCAGPSALSSAIAGCVSEHPPLPPPGPAEYTYMEGGSPVVFTSSRMFASSVCVYGGSFT